MEDVSFEGSNVATGTGGNVAAVNNVGVFVVNGASLYCERAPLLAQRSDLIRNTKRFNSKQPFSSAGAVTRHTCFRSQQPVLLPACHAGLSFPALFMLALTAV